VAVTVERDGPVAWVRLANPPTHLLRSADLGALRRALAELVPDPGCRVVVVAGPPGATPRQLDPSDARAMADAAPPWVPPSWVRWSAAALARSRLLQRALDALPTARVAFLDFLVVARLLEDPRAISLAALTGPVFGGGMELALCCDLRVASDAPDTWLAQPEAVAGVMAGFGATQRLPRLLGTARALELLLLGEAIDPHQALAWGLVQRVLDAQRFDEALSALAQRLARRPPAAVAGTLAAVHQGMGRPLARGLDVELAQVQRVWQSPQAHAGLARVATLADDPSVHDLPLPELLERFETL
jgi:enoyl-CoA hydratase/carnithine racemase